MLNIDTPETKDPDEAVQCLGPEASAFLASLIPVGTAVRLEYDEERIDRYGRTLAGALTADGALVNAEVARAGLAAVVDFDDNDRFLPPVQEAQQEAAEQRRGLYAPDVPCTLPAKVETVTAAVAAAPTAGSQPATASAAMLETAAGNAATSGSDRGHAEQRLHRAADGGHLVRIHQRRTGSLPLPRRNCLGDSPARGSRPALCCLRGTGPGVDHQRRHGAAHRTRSKTISRTTEAQGRSRTTEAQACSRAAEAARRPAQAGSASRREPLPGLHRAALLRARRQDLETLLTLLRRPSQPGVLAAQRPAGHVVDNRSRGLLANSATVFYKNCDAARAPEAALIQRGEQGIGGLMAIGRVRSQPLGCPPSRSTASRSSSGTRTTCGPSRAQGRAGGTCGDETRILSRKRDWSARLCRDVGAPGAEAPREWRAHTALASGGNLSGASQRKHTNDWASASQSPRP